MLSGAQLHGYYYSPTGTCCPSLRVLYRYKEYLAYAVASLLALTTATIFLVYTCIVHARDFMVL